MPYVRVAALEELPEGTSLYTEIDGTAVVVCRHEGRLYALDGLCPHRNGPLGQGAFSGGRIVCPWHAWEFDCRTGEYDYDPAIRLGRYPVTVVGEEILVDLTAKAT
jgi:nitrite reductase/ring-hydroxylating ferredoxin subunit